MKKISGITLDELRAAFSYPPVYSRWAHPPKVIQPIGEGMADQSFAAEASIETIMQRYAATGSFVDPNVRATRLAAFADWSEGPQSFQDAQNALARASEAFAGLPSRVRDRFGSVPGLLHFLNDPANVDEASKLGLIGEVHRPPEKPASPAGTTAD